MKNSTKYKIFIYSFMIIIALNTIDTFQTYEIMIDTEDRVIESNETLIKLWEKGLFYFLGFKMFVVNLSYVLLWFSSLYISYRLEKYDTENSEWSIIPIIPLMLVLVDLLWVVINNAYLLIFYS